MLGEGVPLTIRKEGSVWNSQGIQKLNPVPKSIIVCILCPGPATWTPNNRFFLERVKYRWRWHDGTHTPHTPRALRPLETHRGSQWEMRWVRINHHMYFYLPWSNVPCCLLQTSICDWIWFQNNKDTHQRRNRQKGRKKRRNSMQVNKWTEVKNRNPTASWLCVTNIHLVNKESAPWKS